jgi:hypothetical protein
MDEVWAKLQAVSIRINADSSPYESDRANSIKLSQNCNQNGWKTFYEGIDALERGCGYSDHSELTALCKTAGLQDNRRLLQIIEQKAKLLDVVIFLRSVDPVIKLAWIKNCSFTKTPVLFECLRQALTETEVIESQADSIVKGLCNLQQKSSEHFRYLLSHHILYKEKMVTIMSKLLEHLPQNGWALLSQCVTFDDITPTKMKFWDQCASKLNWNVVCTEAEPLLDAWSAYIAQSLLGHYRQSLYFNISNVLLTILIYKLDTVEQFLDAMERVLNAGEMAIYRWYEGVTKQFGTLVTCLSIIEHLRYVWINNFTAYGVLFPEKLCSRCLALISQWRYLWVSCGSDNVKEEIIQLDNWLKSVSSV